MRKSQVWQNEFGANVQAGAGRNVEQMGHFMAELDTGNTLENALKKTRKYKVKDLVSKALSESKLMEDRSGVHGWAELYTEHFVEILAEARSLAPRTVTSLKTRIYQPPLSRAS